jgi:hypothetical protein
MDPVSYQFEPARRSIFAEIYFPKKAAYQGAIYDSLEDGLDEAFVRQNLLGNVQALYETELSVYPQWFDPERYDLIAPT